MSVPGVVDLIQGTSPGYNPDAGRLLLWPNSADGNWYQRNSAGVDSLITGVQTVTAADASIVIAGSAAARTVATNTLDVVATQHPPAADWSNNTHKITALTNGSAAQDATAFGQTPAGGNAVTNAQLASMVQQTVKGRAVGAGTGVPTDLTSAQTAALIDPATTTLQGAMQPFQVKKLATWVDAVNDLGADPTGAADFSGALQTWINGLTGPAVLWLGPGVMPKIAANVNFNKASVRVWGANRQTSGFTTSTATGNMFTVSATDVVFENLRFIASAANVRTSGYAAQFTAAATSSGAFRCDVIFMWSCLYSQGGLQFFYDITMREYGANAINGACILIDSPGDRYINQITTDSTAPSAGHAGIRVNECASVTMSQFNIIHAGNAMELTPTAGKTVASVNCVNGYFDTSVNGLVVNGTAANGSVYRSSFTRCWFGSHSANGVTMNGVAGGVSQFDGITFDSCDFFGNVIGISCPLGGGSWSVLNSKFAGNTGSAISVTAGTNHDYTIADNKIGPVSAFAANGTGITIGAGAYRRILVHDNDCSGNTTAAITDAGSTATVTKNIYNNSPHLQLGGQLVTLGNNFTAITTETLAVNCTAPANSIQVGTQVLLTAEIAGTQTAAAVTFTVRIRCGPTTLTGSILAIGGAVSPATIRTTESFMVKGLLRFTAVGATGGGIGGAEATGNFLALGTLFGTAAVLAPVLTVNTTVANLIELTIQPSAATFTAGQILAGSVEVLRPAT